VALKVLRDEAMGDRDRLQRMRREGELGRRLDHPNILPVLELLETEGRPVLVLPLVDGAPLDRWEPRGADGTPLPGTDHLPARLAALSTLARAVHCAHEQGVVHRDIKPSNLLVTRDGHPWLIDLGLATDPSAELSLTSSEAVMGTPSSMAPEVVAGRAKQADARTDVYALGVVAYELAAGRPPFTGATREELWQRVLHAEPPRLAGRVVGLPPGLEALVLRALDKDPARRPDSALEFAEALERVLAGDSTPGSAAGPLARRGARQLLRRRAVLLTVALAVLSVAAWMLVERNRAQSDELSLRTALAEGDRSLSNGDLLEALRRYALAQTEHPTDPRPHLHAAHAYANFELLGRAADAVDAARAAGWDDGGSGPARSPEQLYFVGLHRAATEDTEAGLAEVAAALTADPDLEGGRGVLYALQAGQGHQAQARATLDAWGRDLKPRDPRSALVDALRLEADGQVAEAVERLLAVPSGAGAGGAPTFWLHRNLGRLWLQLDRLAEAEEQLLLAVDTVPQDAVSHYNLGLVEWERGDIPATQARAERALSHAPSMGLAHVLVANCALARGELELAAQLSDAPYLPGPAGERMQRLHAQVLFEQAGKAGDSATAIRLLQRCVQTHDDRLDGWAALGFARWGAKEFSAGRDAFARARELWLGRPGPSAQKAEPWEVVYGNPDDLLDVLVGLFATSAFCGDEQGARSALAELDGRLGGSAPAGPSTALNLAEALATCPLPLLRDTARAQALLEEPTVAAEIARNADAARAAEVIRKAIAADGPRE
jgi:tetratricopeptide (TPR) repeat protein